MSAPAEAVAGWRKSSHSINAGNCVEVAGTRLAVLVRDTKDREGGTLAIPATAWSEFALRIRSNNRAA